MSIDGLVLSHDGGHHAPDRMEVAALMPATWEIASTRRLTLAVLGVSEAVQLPVLRDALHDKAQAARAAGCVDSAAAFEAAGRYVARAVEPRPAALIDAVRPAQPSRTVLMAAAVRQVRRGFALLPDEQVRLLNSPDGLPDPAFIERPAALVEDLGGLCAWSGLSPASIAAAARRHGLNVTEGQLSATLENHRFPTPAVTEAIARGCGLNEQQCCAWLAARHRAARVFLRGPNAESGPHEPELAALAELDPRQAETPAQLSVLLAELRVRSGFGYGQVHVAAKRAGHAVSWTRLWAVGARYAFPTPRVLEAFLSGCGIAPEDSAPWLDARARLAARRTRVRRTARPAAARANVYGSSTRRHGEAPPNPQTARTWAQYCVLLQRLVLWSGRDLTAITQKALESGIPVTREALHYTLSRSTLPGVSTLNAFTVGCGLSSIEQLHWRIVRARLAALPPESQRLPPAFPARVGAVGRG